MTRVLKIKGRTGLFDTPSFLVSENEELNIKVEIVGEIRIGKYRLSVKHGKEQKQFSLSKSDKITLTPEFLKNNAENLEFSLLFLNTTETEVIKNDYQIEPLKLENANGNFEFTAIMQEFERKQKELEQRLLVAEELIKSYENDGVPLTFEE